ncbi:APC family permease [Candidatus Peregrinibacteria bacterium]|nr:APC family permease [Candidatus Peregrinibacteria bacterium]
MKSDTIFTKLRKIFLGKPLATSAIVHERLTNMQGLAIFGADPLSSTAYATEEILLVLAIVGTSAFSIAIPIALSIFCLIFVVAISYHQVIHAYPQGGGVYNVAHKNLGEYPALIGAASLLIDYVLTAAVSTAAGVAAITSAVPDFYPHRVTIGIGVVVVLMWMNLRGVRDSGRVFSIPTYIFVASFVGMIGYGVWRYVSGTFPVTHALEVPIEPMGALGILLILRAFAAGCTAMTGIEAISNGTQAFKSPEAENAARTLRRMAYMLGGIFLGITVLAYWGRVTPLAEETIISQIAKLLFDQSPLYFFIQGATALILLLAANTPFADFPRVASQLAQDGYLPRHFRNLGSKLVFANGVILLAFFAAALIYMFEAKVHALIPLYAVGVFLGFSLSQLGMIVHWLHKGPGHQKNILINVIGLVTTAIVFIIVFLSKFLHGAWILIPAILFIVSFMRGIKRHYFKVEHVLALNGQPLPNVMPEKTAVLLVSRLNRGTLYALKLAQSFQPAHIRAVHSAIDPEEGEEVRRQWEKHVADIPIDILNTEYRDLIGPILRYLKDLDAKWENNSLIVFLPQTALNRWWHFFLHNQTNKKIRLAIEQDPDINPDIYEVTVKTPRQ